MIPVPEFSDLEEFLAGEIRSRLVEHLPDGYTGDDLHLDNKEPSPWPPGWVVIVRLDATSRLSLLTEAATIGIRLRAPDTGIAERQASQLARKVKQIIATCPRPGGSSPVVACTNQNGPYRVKGPSDLTRPEFYQTAELVVVGTP